MTPRSDPSHLISGHATDTLSAPERSQLYRAALDDQEIFDQLVEEEAWRQIFSSPGVRDRLLRALDEPAPSPGWLAGIKTWVEGLSMQPMALGTAAAALLAVALIPRWIDVGSGGPVDLGAATPGVGTPGAATPGVATPGATSPPTEFVAKSYSGARATRSLQPKSVGSEILNLSYTLELNRRGGPRQVADSYAFGPGDQFRLRLSVDFTAWAYLFNRASGDAVYAVLYPHTDAERGPLPPSERDVLLPADVWLTMDETPADEELVLVVADRPWELSEDREAIPVAELDAALAGAEASFATRNWRRSEVDGRVRLEVEEGGGLVAVLRLLGG